MSEEQVPTAGAPREFSGVDWVKQGWETIRPAYWLFFGITAVAMLLGSAAFGILWGPMSAGIFYCLMKRERGEAVEFGDLFRGFDYFADTLVAWLILSAFAIGAWVAVLLILGVFLTLAGVLPSVLGWLFGGIGVLAAAAVVVAASVALLALNALVFPLIVERKLKPWPAVVTAYRSARAHPKPMVVMGLLLLLLYAGGTLACGVGTLFVAPVVFAAMFAAYRNLFAAAAAPTLEEAPDAGPSGGAA